MKITSPVSLLVNFKKKIRKIKSFFYLYFLYKKKWTAEGETFNDLFELLVKIFENKQKIELFDEKSKASILIKNSIQELIDRSTKFEIFLNEAKKYEDNAKSLNFIVPLKRNYYPCLDDKTSSTGFDRHYLYHPIWALNKIKEIRPIKHIDISSTVFFPAAASLLCDVEFFDYRPADIILPNLHCGKADLLSLHFSSNSISSLSCMHVIEHIGLGRYGDPIDAAGDIKAAKELVRVLAPGGSLLIVLPFGKSKISFNAHRIYSLDDVKKLFDGLILEEFTLISEDPSDGGLLINPETIMQEKQNYGCGCYLFKKY